MGTKHDDKLVWVDIETFGFDKADDPILEVGIFVTDADLNIWIHKEVLIWDERQATAYEKLDPDDWVFKTHTKNKLFEEAGDFGIKEKAAEEILVNFLADKDLVGMPMCGSSIDFDRGFLHERMPTLEQLFHHRSINLSSVKELCKRWNPELYSKLHANTVKRDKHRVQACLLDTLSEARFYKDNFMFVTV